MIELGCSWFKWLSMLWSKPSSQQQERGQVGDNKDVMVLFLRYYKWRYWVKERENFLYNEIEVITMMDHIHKWAYIWYQCSGGVLHNRLSRTHQSNPISLTHSFLTSYDHFFDWHVIVIHYDCPRGLDNVMDNSQNVLQSICIANTSVPPWHHLIH